MRTHNSTLKSCGTRSQTVQQRIEFAFNQATPDQIAQGLRWYNKGRALARRLAREGAITPAQAACVIAHLSPRQSWKRNKAMAEELVLTGHTRGLGGGIARAMRAMAEDDPFDTFGPTAHKTRSFAHNLNGNLEEVTVDVWVLRLVGLSDAELGRVGVYEAIADAYRKVAHKLGIAPAVLQAITWIVVRGYHE